MLQLLLALLCVQAERKTENVVLVTLDGLRWQEVFAGAEERLVSKELGRVGDIPALKTAYWRETPEARRVALMPFLWELVAKRGQIYGNAAKGSVARATNGLNFSYPGYGEILSGFGDPRIDSNKKVPNANVTVLEWLAKRPGFEKRVAAYCSWDVFPAIYNRERSGLPTFAGEAGPAAGAYADLLREIPVPWSPGSAYDALTFLPALEYLRKEKPRVFHLALGETDEWAHLGRYDLYLDAAKRADRYLKVLWEALQGLPEYAEKTTLLVTTDHGRGHEGTSWRDHGKSVAGADRIWIAALGPDTRPLGERAKIRDVTQSQIAATLAELLGQDYRAEVPQAGGSIGEILR